MDLFANEHDSPHNLLPFDGTVHYFHTAIARDTADASFENLLHNIAWQHDEARIFGKHIVTRRKVAWYGDAPFHYTYSRVTKQALPWTDTLVTLKNLAEEVTGERFNSCLLNLYHDGSEGMGWHSDGERDLRKHGAIASVSLGAERKFAFRHKQSKHTTSLTLAHGSLLVMRDQTQTHWLHRLPPTKKIATPRINLTFRTIVNQVI
ncbi:alpha-ketoglutarate-dependent dioxygenase AlkB [Kineobactrum sediminis]|uniref:Alpha-ketoglutarate-dependent dioxygenase AlkB n=1 Tax=Kineobactrum sediminis TaxID=1905677 RepID=A0A2N5XY28_9GAMM|nr:alpha-ketoglutarate-dependent dioxygenase AlkB [Kineobactrum sediminis]PLW81046.1 alpha-ketoglutarate-dependent dioxygenase AlkB [Kineobactrum sediminis]